MEHILTPFLLWLFALFITVTDGEGNVCSRPHLPDNTKLDGLQRYFNPGAELGLACEQGYTRVLGPPTIVCKANGEWTKTKLLCQPKQCPYPGPLSNGELYYEDTVYQSIVNYTCHEGYNLIGASVAECLANATWSAPVPECNPVRCDLAPIPEFGTVVYNRRIRGNTTHYGDHVKYKCLPPNALFGEATAKCTAAGTWTKTPTCKVVICPPPENIDRGYMSQSDRRSYFYKDTINYGCHGDFGIEGSPQIICQENGKWSEKPSCKAPCSVGIKRGRIFYNGRPIWIGDFKPNRVFHRDTVSVYCRDKARSCNYKVPTQCSDGTLTIPGCFEEPSLIPYSLNIGTFPSENEPC